MTQEELAALFIQKAAEPPPEANLILARHLKSRESCDLAHAVSEAMSRHVATGSHSAPDAAGSASTAGIATLAPAFGQALPSLADVRTEYSHEVNAELVYELCAALVREGLGTAETWKQSGGNALAFAQNAMMSGIGAERGDLLQRNVEYHLEVSDVLGRAGSDAALESGQLAVTVECGGAGYFKIGPAIDALEAEAEGLGAAFYWALTHALYRVMRIYNHDDALMYEERMREYAAQDDEENRGQYEFPEVEKALPECIRKTLKRECCDWKNARPRIAAQVPQWEIRLPYVSGSSGCGASSVSPGFVSSSPGITSKLVNTMSLHCRALLVTFKEHDAITACFDEEGQSMMEGTRRANPVRRLFAAARRMKFGTHCGSWSVLSRSIANSFRLVEAIQEWEKRYAGACIDRGEPSLRAA